MTENAVLEPTGIAFATPIHRSPKVLVVAGYAPSLLRFRGPLLRDMVAAGCTVVSCAPENDAEVREELAAMRVAYRQVPMARAGLNPLTDLGTLFHLGWLMRQERPDVVLTYTMKPVTYGGIAARLAGVPHRFAMITGRGYVFSENPGLAGRLMQGPLARLQRIALGGSEGVFFQNEDDRAEFARRGILGPRQKVVQIAGSGVDTAEFPVAPLPDGPPVFLLISRLLRDKGLGEFIAAARIMRSRQPELRFQILGPLDPNPRGVTAAEVEAWRSEGVVEYLGATRDVRPFLRDCTVFVLPSYYPEGLPRTLLEAMATGRPVITTNTPGCRETVAPGENGYLVPARDVPALVAAMRKFVDEPGLAAAMGRRARELAELRFDVRSVNATLLSTMGLA